jgi:hypothetical protein
MLSVVSVLLGLTMLTAGQEANTDRFEKVMSRLVKGINKPNYPAYSAQ